MMIDIPEVIQAVELLNEFEARNADSLKSLKMLISTLVVSAYVKGKGEKKFSSCDCEDCK
jgi:hypothetical protein